MKEENSMNASVCLSSNIERDTSCKKLNRPRGLGERLTTMLRETYENCTLGTTHTGNVFINGNHCAIRRTTAGFIVVEGLGNGPHMVAWC